MTTYQYTTSADGLCEFSAKSAAIRAALRAKALRVTAYPSNRTVWSNPSGGENEHGEVLDLTGRRMRPQPPLD